MIRLAVKEDASRLAEILIFAKRSAYRRIFQNDAVSFGEMQVLNLALDYRDQPEALEQVYVFDDGIVKGMMSWGVSGIDSGLLELKELYIDTFFQREGIGSKMIAYFLDSAQRQGMTGAYLWVLEENCSARKFYEKWGFGNCGVKKVFPETEKYLLKYTKSF